jgi:hypothetical protein
MSPFISPKKKIRELAIVQAFNNCQYTAFADGRSPSLSLLTRRMLPRVTCTHGGFSSKSCYSGFSFFNPSSQTLSSARVHRHFEQTFMNTTCSYKDRPTNALSCSMQRTAVRCILRRYMDLYHTFRDLPPNTLNVEVTQQEPSRSLRMALSCRNM